MGKSNVLKVLLGLYLVAAAALVIANAYFEFFGFWQLLALLALVPAVVSGILYRNFGGVFLPLALLLIVFSEPLGIPISPFPIIAAGVLLTIAFSIMFPGRWRKAKIGDIGGVSGDELTCSVAFGATAKHFQGENVSQMSIDCNFGSVEARFDEVTLDPNGAILNVSVNFGGLDLYIPRDWNVVNELSVAVGGADESGKCTATSESPTLKIIGNVAFGGVDIHYAK
ncbi:MAG: cell wall-active antibiotics response protein [Defluviitaleaceae bacterium]|nr:cell wall-active antibiotics response protein [Defluviitaleaceae bacterium]